MEEHSSIPLWLRHELNELMRTIRSYVGLVVIHSKDNLSIGTYNLLRVGDRLFAITAGHNLDGRYELIRNNAVRTSERYRVISAHKHEDTERDIAIIEVENDPGAAAFDLQQLSVEPPQPSSEDSILALWVVGFPACNSSVDQVSMMLNIGQNAIGAKVVEVADDKLTLLYTDEDVDVLHHDKGYAVSQGKVPESPKGLSGSGVWGLVGVKKDTLFNPARHIKFFGVQHSWLPASRLLNCLPARFVVEMLAKHAPELKEKMKSLFPKVLENL